MHNFADIKQSLRKQDFKELSALIPEYADEDAGKYNRVLRQMIYLAAHEQPGEQSPLGAVYLDAIRDLRTLYEDSEAGPWSLFEVALRYFCTLELREFDKDVTTMQPEDMGQIVMVDDFVASVRSGASDEAVHEAVKLTWIMDNIFYLGEILTELAASTTRDDGFPLILAGAVLKSIDFVESSQLNPLLFLLTEYLSRTGMDVPANVDCADLQDAPFERYFTLVFNADENEVLDTVYLAYARQIWEAVRMKEDSIRYGICRYLESRFTSGEASAHAIEYQTKQGSIQDIIETLINGDMETCHALILGYIRDGTGLGTLFRHLTDVFLEHTSPGRPLKLILLNSYRTAVAFLTPPEQYQAMLKAADLVREVMNQ